MFSYKQNHIYGRGSVEILSSELEKKNLLKREGGSMSLNGACKDTGRGRGSASAPTDAEGFQNE